MAASLREVQEPESEVEIWEDHRREQADVRPLSGQLRSCQRVGVANSGGLIFMDESAEQVAAVWAGRHVQRRRVAAFGRGK